MGAQVDPWGPKGATWVPQCPSGPGAAPSGPSPASGLAQILWAGDLRINQTLALCGLLGLLLAFPLVLWLGLWIAFWLAMAAAGSVLCAGASAVAQEPEYARVPSPEPGPRLSGLVALD